MDNMGLGQIGPYGMGMGGFGQQMPQMGGFGGYGGGFGGYPPQMMGGGFGGYGGYGMPPQMMGGYGGYGGGYGMPQQPAQNPYASMRSGFNRFQSFGKPQGSPMQSQNMPNVAMTMDRPQAYGASDEMIMGLQRQYAAPGQDYRTVTSQQIQERQRMRAQQSPFAPQQPQQAMGSGPMGGQGGGGGGGGGLF
jgi:hypothetical protein